MIFYIDILLNLLNEEAFCYSNVEDFNKLILTSLWQNRGDLLLMKIESHC